ncbi:MAG: hypothetical protein ACXACX_18090 [Candidatus Hodarchaeales archaeon]
MKMQKIEEIRMDVNKSIGIWKDLLLESFNNSIEVIYTKGSSVKNWDTIIDYVPTLSDVDIHFQLKKDSFIMEGPFISMKTSKKLCKEYSSRFYKERPKAVHFPRVQVVLINNALKDSIFTPPRVENINILYGNWKDKPQRDHNSIRNTDLKRLKEDYDYMNLIPEKLFDKIGLDYWILIRQCSWRVSPAPFRLLTQILVDNDPLDIWSWNRSKIHKELEKQSLNKCADLYHEYYEAGWRNFESSFQNKDDLITLIGLAYNIFQEIKQEVKKLN